MTRVAPPVVESIADVIGGTPAVSLKRSVAAAGLTGRIIAKLEYLNPGFSKKDRIGLEMIRQAKADGSLAPGQTVVELTSGNTGTGLAIVCKAMGHPFVAVMSKGNTPERACMMRAFGARVELVDQAPHSVPGQVSGEDLALVEQRAQQLVTDLKAFRANQFELASNPLAHEKHTGPELWEQSGRSIDAFVDFSGSTGSFVGTMRYLRSVNPKVRGYLVEPQGAAALAGEKVTHPNHPIQGGGYALTAPGIMDKSLVTQFVTVTGQQAIEGARKLAEVEGIFGGYSAGANYAAAIALLQSREKGSTLGILIPDSGLKYMSTDLYR